MFWISINDDHLGFQNGCRCIHTHHTLILDTNVDILNHLIHNFCIRFYAKCNLDLFFQDIQVGFFYISHTTEIQNHMVFTCPFHDHHTFTWWCMYWPCEHNTVTMKCNLYLLFQNIQVGFFYLSHTGTNETQDHMVFTCPFHDYHMMFTWSVHFVIFLVNIEHIYFLINTYIICACLPIFFQQRLNRTWSRPQVCFMITVTCSSNAHKCSWYDMPGCRPLVILKLSTVLQITLLKIFRCAFCI